MLDEPTNHLDLDGIRWLERYLSTFPGAVLVVTHDRRFLDETVSRILELDPVTRTLAVYEGGYTAFRAEKQRLFERREEEHRAQERYRRRLEADIARTRGQAGATESTAGGAGSDQLKRYAKKVAKKAKAREGRLERQMAATGLDRAARAGGLVLVHPGRHVPARPPAGGAGARHRGIRRDGGALRGRPRRSRAATGSR